MTANLEWGPGPWDSEPDRVEFESHGFPCLIKRNSYNGTLCGYVAVPPGHPLHGHEYTEYEYHEKYDLRVHGGITYSDFCDGDEGTGICHVPKPGEPADVFWFGFDMGHCDDLTPSMDGPESKSNLRMKAMNPELFRDSGNTYRTVGYVKKECQRLAKHLAAIG